MIFCFFHDEMALLQFYIDQLELISLPFQSSNLSTFLFCKQIILCFSACFQELATVFIDSFSSSVSSFNEISCFVSGYLLNVSKFRF